MECTKDSYKLGQAKLEYVKTTLLEKSRDRSFLSQPDFAQTESGTHVHPIDFRWPFFGRISCEIINKRER